MGKLATNILKTASVGKHSDGAGLYLLITGHDAKGSAKGSWIFRYTYLKQRYETGIGSIQSLSLARARAECDRWRDLMNDRRNPVNPMDVKRRLETNALHRRAALTLAEVAPLVFAIAAVCPARAWKSQGRRYSPAGYRTRLQTYLADQGADRKEGVASSGQSFKACSSHGAGGQFQHSSQCQETTW